MHATAVMTASAILAALLLAPAPAAAPTSEDSIIADTWKFERDGSWTLTGGVQINYSTGIRITSQNARGVDKPGNVTEIDLSTDVHVEFRGAVLDADTAFVVIRDEQLVSVAVKGSQARFSHPRKDSGRRIEGRASAIDYDSATNEVRFTGTTYWTNGRFDVSSDVVIYDLETGGFTGPYGGQLRRTGQGAGQDVPPPRPPDRSTAQ